MMEYPVIDVRHISVTLGQTKIIKEATCSVHRGTFTAIIGPNGSGKSTFLKAICRLVPVTEGTISINGKDVSSLGRRQLAQTMALVSQRHEFPSDMTALDIVRMGRFPYKKRFTRESATDRKAVEKALILTHVKAFKNRPMKFLSGGEQQRVFLAMALAQETEILLLDEPTTYLDISYQREVLDLLAHLCKDIGITILAVIHDVNQALAYAQYTAAIKDGSIVAQGNTQDVMTPSLMKQVFSVSAHLETTTKGKRFILY